MDTPIDMRRSSNMKTNFCIPRLRGSTRKSTRLISPMSLLERFRVAVFRLIMMQSALSKSTTHEKKTSSSAVHQYHRSCYSYDSHHNEAVADCIEFIKKSSTIDDEDRQSTASTNGGRSAKDGASTDGGTRITKQSG
ncbi:Transducin/WD40 repeat superfamily protein [Heracleum sosnowskyi]|uniref:Transducin/WD40 repeat superfamily protein n=1 Tax=Heracleum sosnowskyi TaxID=360622 RepID=A0AAD8M0T7_9APIA|nr:Transducin/WD40 repeat superfamily protein [Heracleum sosnowskyi]